MNAAHKLVPAQFLAHLVRFRDEQVVRFVERVQLALEPLCAALGAWLRVLQLGHAQTERLHQLCRVPRLHAASRARVSERHGTGEAYVWAAWGEQQRASAARVERRVRVVDAHVEVGGCARARVVVVRGGCARRADGVDVGVWHDAVERRLSICGTDAAYVWEDVEVARTRHGREPIARSAGGKLVAVATRGRVRWIWIDEDIRERSVRSASAKRLLLLWERVKIIITTPRVS